MINKFVGTVADALAGIKDGAVILVGGFGAVGQANNLIDGLIELGLRDLTVVANNAGYRQAGLARLLQLRRVRKIICSFPRIAGSTSFEELYRAGDIELELVDHLVGKDVIVVGVGARQREGVAVPEKVGKAAGALVDFSA